jgi:hypothetical protein
MRPFKWILGFLLTAFSVSSCFIDINDEPFDGGCLRGQGAIISEDMSLNRIDAIDLQLPAKVYLRQGSEQQVVVEGQANVIDNLERTVRGGLWKIGTERCIRDMEELRIFITVPEVAAIKLSSSGQIFSENELVADDLDLEISGSGNINLSLMADDIETSIPGSGNLRLMGAADELGFDLTGSGSLQAFDLEARKGDLNIEGSGDAEVHVTEELNVSISGSGDVFYHGKPSLNVAITGSGEVIDAN